MRVGKLPYPLLEKLLAKARLDARVVVGPQVGEDAAVIEFGPNYLVAKTDPITFTSDLIGWYAVNINANDIAAMGAQPKWFMISLLLPESASEKDVEQIFDQTLSACQSLDISLVGGHTEITYDLDRPIVVGCMLGEVERDQLVTSAGAHPGDDIIITSGIAIEGCSILALEAGDRMRQAGVGEEIIAEAKQYLFEPGISVVEEARLACRSAQVTSLHDPTEGGLATGLYEVGKASGVGMVVEREAIPILPACQVICQALDLNPLGLIASGCLIITLSPEETPKLLAAFANSGKEAARIGQVAKAEREIKIIEDGEEHNLPVSEQDEVARFLSQGGPQAP